MLNSISRSFSRVFSGFITTQCGLETLAFQEYRSSRIHKQNMEIELFFILFCSLRIIGRTSSKDNSDHPLDTATESKMASAVPQEQQRAMSNKLSVSPSFPAGKIILFPFPLRKRRAKNSRDLLISCYKMYIKYRFSNYNCIIMLLIQNFGSLVIRRPIM